MGDRILNLLAFSEGILSLLAFSEGNLTFLRILRWNPKLNMFCTMAFSDGIQNSTLFCTMAFSDGIQISNFQAFVSPCILLRHSQKESCISMAFCLETWNKHLLMV